MSFTYVKDLCGKNAIRNFERVQKMEAERRMDNSPKEKIKALSEALRILNNKLLGQASRIESLEHHVELLLRNVRIEKGVT